MPRKTYREALMWASSLFQPHRSDRSGCHAVHTHGAERTSGSIFQPTLNPKIAEWLLLHLTADDRTSWLQRLDDRMTEEHWVTYQEWVSRVLDGEPYQYVIGTQEFYGRPFFVNANVLIPRPETELLVEHVLRVGRWFVPEASRIVDVGTGSGAIAVTLALEWEETDVWATDISSAALSVAKQNAQSLNAHVHFLQGNLLEPYIKLCAPERNVDILVSNPPYIPLEQRESLARTVLDFEPHTALFAMEEGTYFYRHILKQAQSVLADRSLIAFEVGIGQAEAVQALIHEYFPSADVQISMDLQGIERIVTAAIG